MSQPTMIRHGTETVRSTFSCKRSAFYRSLSNVLRENLSLLLVFILFSTPPFAFADRITGTLHIEVRTALQGGITHQFFLEPLRGPRMRLQISEQLVGIAEHNRTQRVILSGKISKDKKEFIRRHCHRGSSETTEADIKSLVLQFKREFLEI